MRDLRRRAGPIVRLRIPVGQIASDYRSSGSVGDADDGGRQASGDEARATQAEGPRSRIVVGSRGSQASVGPAVGSSRDDFGP